MISLVEHIEYLMMSNPCVVVPGWGAFIAQSTQATFNGDTATFSRPRRSIGFNEQVSHDDGLLANSIVSIEGIPYTAAGKIIAQHVASWRQLLQEGSEVPFGHLGFFALNAEGHLEFIPFYHEIDNDEYFGLRQFAFKTLAQVQSEEAEAAAQKRAAVIPLNPSDGDEKTGKRRKWMRRVAATAASIVLLLGLSVALTTPIVVDNQQQQQAMATLNVPAIKPQPRQQVTIKPAQKPASKPVAAKPQTPAKPQAAAPQPKVEPKQETAPVAQPANNSSLAAFTNQATTGRYYLVICTLSSQKQVNDYLASNSNIKPMAKVQKHGKKYRIYIDRSNDYKALYDKAKRLLPAEYNDFWIAHD